MEIFPDVMNGDNNTGKASVELQVQYKCDFFAGFGVGGHSGFDSHARHRSGMVSVGWLLKSLVASHDQFLSPKPVKL